MYVQQCQMVTNNINKRRIPRTVYGVQLSFSFYEKYPQKNYSQKFKFKEIKLFLYYILYLYVDLFSNRVCLKYLGQSIDDIK